MSINDNNAPVTLTGEERRPALRLLAKACIALARLRLEQNNLEAHADGNGTSAAAEKLEGKNA